VSDAGRGWIKGSAYSGVNAVIAGHAWIPGSRTMRSTSWRALVRRASRASAKASLCRASGFIERRPSMLGRSWPGRFVASWALMSRRQAFRPIEPADALAIISPVFPPHAAPASRFPLQAVAAGVVRRASARRMASSSWRASLRRSRACDMSLRPPSPAPPASVQTRSVLRRTCSSSWPSCPRGRAMLRSGLLPGSGSQGQLSAPARRKHREDCNLRLTINGLFEMRRIFVLVLHLMD
jgi:hypothetical protein